MTIKVGGVNVEVSDAGVAITGGKVTHDGRNNRLQSYPWGCCLGRRPDGCAKRIEVRRLGGLIAASYAENRLLRFAEIRGYIRRKSCGEQTCTSTNSHDWPHFWWKDQTIATPLAAVRHRQGLLIGRMEALGFSLQEEAVLETLTEDVLKSSRLKARSWTRTSVRSSIARRLGIDIGALTPADRDSRAWSR